MDNKFTVSKLTDKEFTSLEKAVLPNVVPLEQSPLWGSFDNSIEGRSQHYPCNNQTKTYIAQHN